MTPSQNSANKPSPKVEGAVPDAQGWVTYQVQMRPEQAALLRSLAAREGATPEALAALWLEEKLGEAQHLLKKNS